MMAMNAVGFQPYHLLHRATIYLGFFWVSKCEFGQNRRNRKRSSMAAGVRRDPYCTMSCFLLLTGLAGAQNHCGDRWVGEAFQHLSLPVVQCCLPLEFAVP